MSLKREASNLFKKLFQSNAQCDSLLLQNIPQNSRVLHNTLLHVSRRKVKDVIYSMSPYKAPYFHGIQPIFFTTYCHTLNFTLSFLLASA